MLINGPVYRYNNQNNASSYGQNNRNNVSFGKNVVHLWLDSDGTHFPDDDQSILIADTRKDNGERESRFQKVRDSFNGLNDFIKRFADSIKLNITTGRNVGEYKFFLNLLKNAGLTYHPPESLVIKNGGDAFIISGKGTLNDLVSDGLRSASADQAKRDEIKQLTNWDANYIRTTVLKVLQDVDMPVVFASNGNGDYGDKSMNNLVKDRSSWVGFIREDGDLNFFIGLPVNDAAKGVLKLLSERIKEQLDKKNISYNLETREADWENSNGPVITITPKLGERSLDKDYDVVRALKKAIAEKDLVIVAGNGSNDKKMLDPKTYRKFFTEEQLKDLPLMSVVVGNNKDLSDLPQKHPDKVIKVDSACQLKDGIKSAMKKYCETHPEFKLKPELKKEVLS